MRSHVLLVFVLALARTAHAGGIVLESHAGTRPSDATRLLDPIYRALEQRGYTGRVALGRLYSERISRGVTTAASVAPDFAASVERGHRAAIGGDSELAISTLTPLVADAESHSPAVAQSQLLREAFQKALTGLALALHHKGDLDAAKSTLLELLRTYPDAHVPRSVYGAELAAFSEQVRQAAKERGALTVQVGDNAVVFMNERFVNIGATTRRELVPGIYRVYAQLSKNQMSRVHSVEVKAGEEAVVTLDAAFETAVVTSGEWTGLAFASEAEREAHGDVYAARVARELAVGSAIVLAIDSTKGRTSVTGVQVDVASGRQLRRATVLMTSTTSDERLVALAVFLAGGKSAAGVDVALGTDEVIDADADDEEEGDKTVDAAPMHRGDRRARMLLWTGIGAVALGAAVGGGLAWSFHGDAVAAGEQLASTCAVTCTPMQVRALDDEQTRANHNATISLVAGGAVVVTGVVLIVMSRLDSSPSSVAIAPVAGGAIGSYATSF